MFVTITSGSFEITTTVYLATVYHLVLIVGIQETKDQLKRMTLRDLVINGKEVGQSQCFESPKQECTESRRMDFMCPFQSLILVYFFLIFCVFQCWGPVSQYRNLLNSLWDQVKDKKILEETEVKYVIQKVMELKWRWVGRAAKFSDRNNRYYDTVIRGPERRRREKMEEWMKTASWAEATPRNWKRLTKVESLR